MRITRQNTKQWVLLLVLTAILSFSWNGGIRAQAYAVYTVDNYTYDTEIYLAPYDKCVIKGNDSTITQYEYYGDNEIVAAVDMYSGEVTAYSSGITNIMVLGYDDYSSVCFYAEVMICVDENQNGYNPNPDYGYEEPDYGYGEPDYDYGEPDYGYEEVVVPVDMTNAVLDKTSVKAKAMQSGYGSWLWYNTSIEINLLNTPEPVSSWMESVDFSYKSSNESMWVNCYLYDNVITVDISGSGETTVEFTINGKVLSCDIKVVPVYISSNGIVLAKGKTKTLKVKNGGSDVSWESLNPDIATVSSKGKVTAKKGGTAIIIATMDENKFGCAVNVTTSSMKKIVDRAQKIATGTYSQAKRMQNGYYDCSSLVWRAYSPEGIKFGNNNWAPVAADIGKWSMKNGKKISNELSEAQIQKQKLKVGDLLFKTGSGNGRYKGIDHVEMFIGYGYAGMDYDGSVYLTTKLAARSDGYGYGMLVVRPKK